MEGIQDSINLQRLISLGLLLLGLLLSVIFIVLRAYIKKVNQTYQEKMEADGNHKRALLISSLETQEKERKRIAIDIHDDLIAQLNRLRYSISDQEEIIEKIMSSARRISHDLSPPLIEELSFTILIIDHLEPLRKKILFLESYKDYIKISYNHKLQLYRVFQELVTNILKHSEADTVVLNFRSSVRWVYFSIEDNGIGMGEKSKNGLGMKNIEIRNEIIKGIYDFNKNNNNKGVKFRILLKKQ